MNILINYIYCNKLIYHYIITINKYVIITIDNYSI